MVRQIFKNRVIATAGPLPGQLTVENVQRWTKLRRGRFSEDLDENVTHLLCSREQFNRRVPRVKEVLSRYKRCHIIHYDWFEFSAVAEKKLDEREYSMRNILAKENARKRELARVERGKREGEKFVNTNYYHVYTDRENFQYNIDLTRNDEELGEVGQKYTLVLWESNAWPHLYWFTVKFLKRAKDSQPNYLRPSPCPGKWRGEMEQFMAFFKIKTGVDWEDRVIKAHTMPASHFQYAPPTGGKPVGRRLRFNYEYCRELNAELGDLPWPPPEPANKIEEIAAEAKAPCYGPLVYGVEDAYEQGEGGDAQIGGGLATPLDSEPQEPVPVDIVETAAVEAEEAEGVHLTTPPSDTVDAAEESNDQVCE